METPNSFQPFSTYNTILYLFESEGFSQEEGDSSFVKKNSKATITSNYSVFSQNLDTLNFTSWIFTTKRDSFLMVNHFIKINSGQGYFSSELEKYIKLIENISSVEFSESFYVIYCGPLNVKIEKEVFENQNVFYLYMNIDSTYEDIERIAGMRFCD